MKTTAQSTITLFIGHRGYALVFQGLLSLFFPSLWKPGRYPKLFLTFQSSVKGWPA